MRAKYTTSILVCLAVTSISACGDDDGGKREVDASSDVDANIEVDAIPEIEEVEADAEPDGEVDSEVDAEPGSDTEFDVDSDSDSDSDADVEVSPQVCADFEACDALLDGEGRCPGTCRSTDDRLRCDGFVKHSVCNTYEPVETPTEAVDFGRFTVTPITWPEDAVVGETYDFEVRVDNDTQSPLTLSFSWKNPQTFAFADASWDRIASIELPANGSVTLTAQITALQATTLSAGSNLIVTLVFDGDSAFEPRATVHFPATEAISCGGEYFPANWCPGEGCYASHTYYSQARCCDDVFFPGATCCDDSECDLGACVDGKCVFETPYLTSANNLPIGKQRVRIVLVDTHPQLTDPCADHYEDVKSEFDFGTTEAWYDDLSQRRIGRNSVDFQWIITGGVATSDFLTGPNYWDDYSRELNAYLEQRGCPIFDAYDKVLISASSIDLQGFGGFYVNKGNIAIFSAHGAYLVAHELAHSFGATDLYLDLGGAFLYPQALMGNNLAAPPLPNDKVAWGEMGFADIDRNGIIDVVEFAAFPDSLAVANATATITSKGSLEIRWELVATEGGIVKRVVVPEYTVTVPAANASFTLYYPGRWKVVTFDATQVDLDALTLAGSVEVTIAVAYRFTANDWTPKTLHVNETLQLQVVLE